MHIKDIIQTKTYRWARYLTINSIFATCIYFGLFMGVEGAENVALFMGWGTSILGMILLLAIAADSVQTPKVSISNIFPGRTQHQYHFGLI